MRLDRRQPRALHFSAVLYHALVALYPRGTRHLFGAELRAVVAELLADAQARGGTWGVLRLWPRLILDWGIALGQEYVDAWQRTRIGHAAVTFCLLPCAATIWGLIAVASNFDADWAIRLLDASVPLTVALALGLPLAAFASAHVALRRARRTGPALRRPRLLRQMSAASTLAAWSVFACHVAG